VLYYKREDSGRELLVHVTKNGDFRLVMQRSQMG